MTLADREALTKAVKSLEHPSLAARLANLIGKPVELIGYALTSFASKAIASATSKGLEAALKVALPTCVLCLSDCAEPALWLFRSGYFGCEFDGQFGGAHSI